MTYTIAAIYKFVDLSDLPQLQEQIHHLCTNHDVFGTLLLATEGINGTIAGQSTDIKAVLHWLDTHLTIGPIEAKISHAAEQPFLRLKVRLKKEIVTLGINGVNPSKDVGTYVAAQDWNSLIADPEVVLIDTRNKYEVAIGTFEGAINPCTRSFREFPQYVQQLKKELGGQKKKIAMFCTGGIRCEKASSYMLSQGFDEVYHLKGGILKYLEHIPAQKSKWSGECFVFDGRVSVRHGLEVGAYDMCHACRMPIAMEAKASPDYRPGVSCPHCVGTHSAHDIARFEERQKQIELAKARNEIHLGAAAGSKFPKGKAAKSD